MVVDEDYINRRIDKYLRDCFGYLQSKICVLSKQKKILVNNQCVKFNYKLQKGDDINILDTYFQEKKNNKINDCLEYDRDDKKHNKKDYKQNAINGEKFNNDNNKNNKKDLPIEMIYKLKNAIIFEDENVLVLNKPYGISVQGGTGVRYCLEDFFSILSDKKLRIVHRIDKDTRGILILAKNVPTSVKLTDMFRKREVHKKYLAVLSGIPIKSSGTIKTYITQSNEDNIVYNARNAEERYNGKQAITKYKVIKTNKEKNISLVEFYPLTGRKHQIRIHAQHIKCPILGDQKYSFEKQKNKKLQLFAVAIDASPIIKIELNEKDLKEIEEV